MNILKAFSLISRTLFDVVVVMIGDAMDYLLKTGTGHHKLADARIMIRGGCIEEEVTWSNASNTMTTDYIQIHIRYTEATTDVVNLDEISMRRAVFLTHKIWIDARSFRQDRDRDNIPLTAKGLISGKAQPRDWLERCLSVDEKSDIDDVGNDVDSIVPPEDSPEARKGTYARLRSASKPHSTPQTLKWLEENYEIADGVCIPRSTLYVHYLDFCERNDTQPVNAASFGKIIRQQFTQITTRRLGTRGQSKYHYYGIGVRESSHYFEVVYSAKGVQSSMDGRKDPGKQIIAYSPRSKLGTLLPDFPDIKDIDLPANVPEDKVLTFLMMYRTHCQRILDTVIRANFDEVQSFLLHFWQGMPNHIRTILESRAIVTLVGVCDSILYRAIANVLMPTVLQPLPESLTQVIRKFSMQLDDWLRQALDRLPPTLQRIKFDLSRRFAQVLKRQTSLNHLCQAARTVIHSAEITSQMLDDWINVDLNSIVKQTLYTMDNYSDREHNFIVKLTQEFEVLLEEQSPLESYIEWLDGMVDQCVVQASKASRNLRRTARQFLLMWSCFGTRVIRDMTLHSAPSFGSFHLLHLMFDEYVLYLVENLHCQERGNELLRAAKGEQNIDFLEDSFAIDPGSASPSMRSPSCVTSRTCARDLDRRSVIRGPEYTQPQTGRLEGFPYISPPQSAVGGCVPNVNIYKEMPDGVSEGPPPAGHFPPTHHPPFAQPTYPPHATSRQHLYHQVTDPRDNSASLAIKQTETHTAGNNASAHAYDWYDWSSRPVTSHAGTNNNINKNNNMDGHFVRNHTVSRLPESDGQMYSNFQGSDLQAGIQSFSQCGNNNNSYKRTITDNQSGKRKLNDDISGVNYKHNMADLYQYHMTSLI